MSLSARGVKEDCEKCNFPTGSHSAAASVFLSLADVSTSLRPHLLNDNKTRKSDRLKEQV
jgi:hypothetical protein